MNMKQLQYVLALARSGSFSRAAEELHISQPSLSQYIKNIEKEVGVPLFVRGSNAVRLTDAGQVYLDSGRKILDLEREMQSRFTDLREDRSGSVILGVSAHRSVCLMPKVLRAFREEYPGVCVVLDERPRSTLLEAAENGEFDLCLTTPPVSDALFSCETVLREEVLLAVPAASPLDRKLSDSSSGRSASGFPSADVRLADGSDFVFLREGHPMQTILDDLIRSQGLSLHKTVECTSLEAVLAMVSVGMGSALVPSCLRSFASGGETVSYYSPAPAIPYRDILLIARRNQYLSRPAQALARLLREISLAP